jgi:hypothetical protein
MTEPDLRIQYDPATRRTFVIETITDSLMFFVENYWDIMPDERPDDAVERVKIQIAKRGVE